MITNMKKSIIDHTYRDYSQTDITDFQDNDRQQTSEELFPSKLHRILNTPEYEDIIAWLPHGRAWKIKNKNYFVSYILPRHFQHSNFESFNRSVNGWGMKRLWQDGPDQKGYYHELFLRGKIDLCGGMHRLKNPGKRLPNKAGEPNFYAISRSYPLDPPPPVTVHNSYINVQGDTRPSPKQKLGRSPHNNIVPLPQQQQYPYGGYNPYMMMNQQQQYQMMPTSPSHQQYHDANLRAYYAQLPYSNPSSIPPSNAAPTPPVHQHPNGGAPVQRLTSAPVPAQAETDEEVYGEEKIDPNDPPVEFDEKLYQRVVAIEKVLPVLHTNQHNKKKGEEEPKVKAMMEQQPPYEDQAAQAATNHPDVLAAFQAHAAQLGSSTSTHV